MRIMVFPRFTKKSIPFILMISVENRRWGFLSNANACHETKKNDWKTYWRFHSWVLIDELVVYRR